MYLGIVLHGEFIEFMLINRQCEIHGYQRERMVDFYDETLFKGAIESGIARVCLKADLKFEDIEFSCVAIPEYGENDHFDGMMQQYFSDIFYHNRFICENEVEAAWLSALGGHEGIVVLVGIGSIAVGKNEMGESVRIGGWGRIAGDEGGEYWLARRMLEVFTKESDGRYPRGELYKLLTHQLGISHDTELYNFSFDDLEQYDVTFDEFVDVLFEAVYQDMYAKSILEECIEEYKMMIEAIQKRLQLNEPITVSYVGRIFNTSNLIQMLNDRLPSCFSIKQPYLYMVTGAALRALMFKEKVNYYDIQTLLKEEVRLNRIT